MHIFCYTVYINFFQIKYILVFQLNNQYVDIQSIKWRYGQECLIFFLYIKHLFTIGQIRFNLQNKKNENILKSALQFTQ